MSRRAGLFFLLVCASGAPASGQPAPARPVADVAPEVVFGLCPAALSGSLDMNSEAALARYALAPVSAADEQRLGARIPNAEGAMARFDDGMVLVTTSSAPDCSLGFTSSDRFAVRDAIIARLRSDGAETGHETLDDGAVIRFFRYGRFYASVLSPTSNNQIMVRLRPAE